MSPMTERQKLLQEIDRFLADYQMAPTHFGRAAMRDATFVARLRLEYRSVRSETLDKLRKWMADYRKAHKKPLLKRPTRGAVRARAA